MKSSSVVMDLVDEEAGDRPLNSWQCFPCFSAECTRCGAQLRLLDNLELAADIGQFFRGTVSDPMAVLEASGSWPEPQPLPGACGSPSQDSAARIERILAYASVQAETDYPVCGVCLQHVVAEVQKQVDHAGTECAVYEEAHSRAMAAFQGHREGQEALEEDICRLGAEERELLAELAALDLEEAELQRNLDSQRLHEEHLQDQEDELWSRSEDFQLDADECDEEIAAATASLRDASSELERLCSTNMLDQMFRISLDGPLGSINQFRLGTLPPEHAVPWDEINAAWGQACLLLEVLTKRSSAPMTRFRLLPRGSFSSVEPLHGAGVLELRGDGSSFMGGKRFDAAMVAFLACLQELLRFLLREVGDFRATHPLPHRISGDTVGGCCVRLQHHRTEEWSSALRHMLMDLKWAIWAVEVQELRD